MNDRPVYTGDSSKPRMLRLLEKKILGRSIGRTDGALSGCCRLQFITPVARCPWRIGPAKFWLEFQLGQLRAQTATAKILTA